MPKLSDQIGFEQTENAETGNTRIIARLMLSGWQRATMRSDITEPWMWITVVMSATQWKNFFRLRCHEDAEIHFQKIAGMIRDALEASTPRKLQAGEWHLPFFDDADWDRLRSMRFDDMRDLMADFRDRDNPTTMFELARRVSTARIARVYYLTHGTSERSFEKDTTLFTTLVNGSGFGHWSPHGHVAQASGIRVKSGPFIGFNQYRKQFANECADVESPHWLVGKNIKPKYQSHRLYSPHASVATIVDVLPDGTYGIEVDKKVPDSGRFLLVIKSPYSVPFIESADEWVTA